MEIFSDFQCPFCKRVEDTLKQVEKNYGDKIKFVWRHKPLPMHQDAPLAAEAAQEVFKQKGNDGVLEVPRHALREAGHAPDGIKRPALESYAEAHGRRHDASSRRRSTRTTNKAFVDRESARRRQGRHQRDARVRRRLDREGQAHGYFISGAQPYGKFKKVIDAALKDAEKK